LRRRRRRLDAATVDVRWRLVRRTGVGLLRLASTKTGRRGERLIPLPSWAVTMLKRRRLAIGPGVEAVFPDSLGGCATRRTSGGCGGRCATRWIWTAW
jgi:integrase